MRKTNRRTKLLRKGRALFKADASAIRKRAIDFEEKRRKLQEQAMFVQDTMFINGKRLEETGPASGQGKALLARKIALEKELNGIMVKIALCDKMNEHFSGFGKR